MKKIKFFAMAAAALLALGACSDDELKGGDGSTINPNLEEGVYCSVQIDLPNKPGSRSKTDTPINGDYGTSTGGVEIGKDYENNVGEVLIVLAQYSQTNATKNNAFIAAATVPEKNLKGIGSDQTSYQVLSSFSKTQLDAFYNSLGSNPASSEFVCNIYVFANPTSGIKAIIFGIEDDDNANGATLGSNAWVNEIRTLNNPPVNSIAKKEAFLMSNATVAVRNIPQRMEDWRFYTTEGNPFDLSGMNADVYIDNSEYNSRGSVKLERAAARFDFRDGSPLAKEGKPFTYHVVYSGSTAEDLANRKPIIDIELINMSLVNVNTKYYPLRRVCTLNETTQQPENIAVCGVEKAWTKTQDDGYIGGNYVLDANYDWKHTVADQFGGGNKPSFINYSGNFFYPFLSNDGTINNETRTNWYTTICKDVLNLEEDNSEGWTPGEGVTDPGDYHIWTYATENTIVHVEDQINGISTGVVFKGKMEATEWALSDEADEDTRELAKAINNVDGILNSETTAPVIYQFGGNLYLGWNKLRNAAIAAAIPEIKWEGDATTGKWVFNIDDINRSNSLYVAVFGTGGIGTVEFTYTEYDKVTGKPIVGTDGKPIQHKGEITDTYPVDVLSSNYLYQAYGTSKNPADIAKYKEAMTDAKISIYQSYRDTQNYGGTGYFVYYYYWNRHNDNGNNGVMGPMEFAVVRNNVYKLAVTDIKKLGHPRITENDPERPTGGTPDEKEDVYLTVTAEVLPWVVRVNNIEF